MMKLPLDFSKPAKDSAFTCTVVYVQHSVLSCVVHEMLLRFSRKSYISMKTLMLQLLNLFILSFMKHSTFMCFPSVDKCRTESNHQSDKTSRHRLFMSVQLPRFSFSLTFSERQKLHKTHSGAHGLYCKCWH